MKQKVAVITGSGLAIVRTGSIDILISRFERHCKHKTSAVRSGSNMG